MLKHTDIWLAVDRLADAHGLSASGLARQAGLDPTTFNRSKRQTRAGRPRWPNTESVAKILAATGMTLAQFVAPIDEGATGVESALPGMKLGKTGPRIAFDAIGHPRGNCWEPVSFPGMTDPAAFALEIIGDEFAPTYRDGDLLVVSPAASLRRGDKVVVLAQAGELILKQFRRKSARRVELTSVTGQGEPLLLGVSDIQWMSRIIWASQ